MMHECPVCKYPKMTNPPAHNNICPSCGTEFGFDDYNKTLEQLRSEWIANGAEWFDPETPQPPNWNPRQQLFDAGIGFEVVVADDADSMLSAGTSWSMYS